MPLEAHYNILVDRSADKCRTGSVATLPSLPMTTDAASLVIGGAMITTKIDSHIRDAKMAGPLKEYIKEKNSWTETEFQLVDWALLGACMGRFSGSKRAKVIKLQHNWQNTGRQKGTFLRSAGEDEKASEEEKCPMGCGCYEDSLHYLVCPNNP